LRIGELRARDSRRVGRVRDGPSIGADDGAFNAIACAFRLRRTARLRPCRSLLHDVRKLMRDQTPAFGTRRRVFAGTEYDIAPERVRARLHRARRIRRRAVRVDAHAREVDAETRLEIRAQRAWQRLSAVRGRAYRASRIQRRESRRCALGLDLFLLLLVLARLAFTLDRNRSRAERRWLRHAHDPIGDCIGFALVVVVRRVDLRLALDSHLRRGKVREIETGY